MPVSAVVAPPWVASSLFVEEGCSSTSLPLSCQGSGKGEEVSHARFRQQTKTAEQTGRFPLHCWGVVLQVWQLLSAICREPVRSCGRRRIGLKKKKKTTCLSPPNPRQQDGAQAIPFGLDFEEGSLCCVEREKERGEPSSAQLLYTAKAQQNRLCIFRLCCRGSVAPPGMAASLGSLLQAC